MLRSVILEYWNTNISVSELSMCDLELWTGYLFQMFHLCKAKHCNLLYSAGKCWILALLLT